VTGVDLLTWAAAGGAARAARMLLDRGADADGGALHAAAGSARPELVRLLLSAGADVDRRDPDTGRCPLHAAVAAGAGGDAPEVVRVLLDAGADVNATTSDGASALDISRVAAARSRQHDAGQATAHDALADLLVARGATD
jgi:ankyrin repeat protein